LHYQIVGRVRIEGESDLLYSIGPIRSSSSFSVLSPFPPSSFFHREHSLCPRPLPLLVFRRRTSFRNERHSFLSFSTVDLRQVLFEKIGERTSREKNALEISFAGQFIEERKQCRVIDENAQRFDFAERGLSTCCKLYVH